MSISAMWATTPSKRSSSNASRSASATSSYAAEPGSMPQYLADRCWLAALARVVPQVRDLRAVPLDRLRVVQQVENAGAVAEVEARVREVVVGIGLRRRA